MMLRQLCLAIWVTAVVGCAWAFGLADREYKAKRDAQAKVWQLEGERDAQRKVSEALALTLAELKAVPPVVCPEPEPPKPVKKKKAAKRVVPVFGKW